mmetsp:Transcript_39958/g.100670  ORF Transcript_39958/g.100670 Transcript_39958/m.100670 type:complete len:246 (+) Transcript_39958:708-1445(+)
MSMPPAELLALTFRDLDCFTRTPLTPLEIVRYVGRTRVAALLSRCTSRAAGHTATQLAGGHTTHMVLLMCSADPIVWSSAKQNPRSTLHVAASHATASPSSANVQICSPTQRMVLTGLVWGLEAHTGEAFCLYTATTPPLYPSHTLCCSGSNVMAVMRVAATRLANSTPVHTTSSWYRDGPSGDRSGAAGMTDSSSDMPLNPVTTKTFVENTAGRSVSAAGLLTHTFGPCTNGRAWHTAAMRSVS